MTYNPQISPAESFFPPPSSPLLASSPISYTPVNFFRPLAPPFLLAPQLSIFRDTAAVDHGEFRATFFSPVVKSFSGDAPGRRRNYPGLIIRSRRPPMGIESPGQKNCDDKFIVTLLSPPLSVKFAFFFQRIDMSPSSLD